MSEGLEIPRDCQVELTALGMEGTEVVERERQIERVSRLTALFRGKDFRAERQSFRGSGLTVFVQGLDEQIRRTVGFARVEPGLDRCQITAFPGLALGTGVRATVKGTSHVFARQIGAAEDVRCSRADDDTPVQPHGDHWTSGPSDGPEDSGRLI